jgi:hypothetical protein
MNREIFSKVVRFVAFKKRQRHLEFIKNCQILQNINEKEMLDIAEHLNLKNINVGIPSFTKDMLQMLVK